MVNDEVDTPSITIGEINKFIDDNEKYFDEICSPDVVALHSRIIVELIGFSAKNSYPIPEVTKNMVATEQIVELYQRLRKKLEHS
jgi:hypothetical protein